MAEHAAADQNHDRTSTYADRSRVNVDESKLRAKLVKDGKVLPKEEQK